MSNLNVTSTQVLSGTGNGISIPTNILQANLISNTCQSNECFVEQQFSNKLQAFLIGYVNSIYSNYSVYK